MPDAPPTELPPRYAAADVQAQVAAVWEVENLFHADPSDPGEPFSVVIPPPNVTAALHLGHALNNTVQDILVRRARMQGRNAVWIPGTDHAGIATQTVVEKRLQQSEGKRRTDYTRDEFVARVQSWKDEYEQTILGQLKAMGCSCDFARTAFTMDEPRAKAVREAFFRLFKDGLIYRGKRLVNWDPATQTALADDEVENEEIDGHFYYLKYPVVDTKADRDAVAEAAGPTDFITVATTRPETMLGDTAVAINPRDPRAASLKGKFVKLPIVDRLIPLIEDDYVVMPTDDDPKAKYATGFLKVTPAHDPNDWDIGQHHNLEVINVMAPDASISDAHGWTPETDAARGFVGMIREDARKSVVQWFKDHDLLAEVKPYRHSVGHSYRSHVPVEPYLSDQWYVAVQKPIPWMPDTGPVEGTSVPRNSLAGLALTALTETRRVGFSPPSGGADAAADGGLKPTLQADPADAPPAPPGSVVAPQSAAAHGSAPRATPDPFPGGDGDGDASFRFVPDRYAKTFHDWNAALRDWCISRQLWWGHRIPVWSRQMTDGTARLLAAALEDKSTIRENLQGMSQEDLQIFHVLMMLPQKHPRLVARSGNYLKPTNRVSLAGVRQTAERAGVDPEQVTAENTTVLEAAPAVALNSVTEQSIGVLEKAGFQQDPDVLDTWFSSALWPMSTLGWPDRTPSLEEWNPTSVLCTAREIITLWVSRMVMFNRYLLAHPDEAAARATSARPDAASARPDVTLGRPRAASGQPDGAAGVPGPVPFREVFIHAMIQDGHGQKMSKSLGNGVDPLDIIDSHGADAMRFTLCGMTTHTQDVRLPVDVLDPHTGEAFAAETFVNAAGYTVFKPVQTHHGKKMVSSYGLATGEATPTPEMPAARNTSAKFDQGRNFCNKLWNAARFVIANLESHHGGTGTRRAESAGEPASAGGAGGVDERAMTVIDRWILSRLARTVDAANKALDDYRFDRYAAACYDFFWRDFCDWYVEAAKPAMRAGGDGPARTGRVLATCLDVSLRLMHPMVPFATERLWWALNEAMPTRGIAGRFDCPPSRRCIRAAWPTQADAVDDEAERAVGRLQDIAQAVRTIRTENKVDPRQTVPVTIRGDVEDVATLALWTTATITARPDAPEPANAAKTTAGGCEVFVAGVVDPAAEAGRVAKERAELEKKVKTLQGRLANKGYTDKAPPHLVQQTRDELEAALLALDQS